MDDEIIRLAQEIKDNDYPLIKIRSMIESLFKERIPNEIIYHHIPDTDLRFYRQMQDQLAEILAIVKHCPDCEYCQKIRDIIEPPIAYG